MNKIYVFILALFILNQLEVGAQIKESGYFNLTSIGAIIGTPNDDFETNSVVPSLSIVNGYSFNNRFSAGVGVGAEIYQYAIFPVFADIRYKIQRSEYSPYFALKGGYSFAKNDKVLDGGYDYYYPSNVIFENKGGWMCNPEVGVYFSIAKHINMNVGVGYRYQHLETKITTPQSVYTSETISDISTAFNRLSFTIGFEFR